jgi:hypothetical protein
LTQSQNEEVKIDEKELARFNEEMIKSDLLVSDNFYIDITMVKDIYLGTLLTFVMEESTGMSAQEGFAYIKENLGEYRKRKFVDMAHSFPGLKVSQKMIQDRIDDTRYASTILKHSPITAFEKYLQEQLAINSNHSRVLGKRDHINFTVNTYPLDLPHKDQMIISVYMATTFGVSVNLIYQKPQAILLQKFMRFDEIYAFHTKELFDNVELQKCMTGMKLLMKKFYVPCFHGYEFDDYRDIEKEERRVGMQYDILTQFRYIPMSLVSPP